MKFSVTTINRNLFFQFNISFLTPVTNHVVYEADIALTERDESTVHEKRKRRNAVRQRKKLWPKRVVPYEISTGMGKIVYRI